MHKRSKESLDSVQKAIKDGGGPSKVAELFGFKSHWAVGKWVLFGVPDSHVIRLEEISRHAGGLETRYTMRPDIYPPVTCPQCGMCINE